MAYEALTSFREESRTQLEGSVQAQFDVLLAKARGDNDAAGLRELEATSTHQ